MPKFFWISLIFSTLTSSLGYAMETCQFPEANSNIPASFQRKLIAACFDLYTHCEISPGHSYCPASKANSKSSASSSAENYSHSGSLENYQNSLRASVEDLFSFRTSIHKSRQKNEIYQITDSEILSYESALQWVNSISADSNPLHQGLSRTFALMATEEWLDLFGRPFLNKDFHLNQNTEETSQGRQDFINYERDMDLAVNLAAIGSAASYIFLHSDNPVARKIVSGVDVLALGFKTRFPIGAIREIIAAGLPLISVGLTKSRKDNMAESLLPTPVHYIHFGFQAENDLSHLEYQRYWQAKEYAIYENALADSSFWGGVFFVGHFGKVFGEKLNSGFWKNFFNGGGKLLHLLRLTPASIIAGFAIEEAVDKGLFTYRLSKSIHRLKAAARSGQLSLVHDEALFLETLHLNSGHLTLEALSLHEDFMSGDRAKLTSHFSPIRQPELTGAKAIKDYICQGVKDLKWRSTVSLGRLDRQTYLQNMDEKQGAAAIRYINDMRENTLKNFQKAYQNYFAFLRDLIRELEALDLSKGVDILSARFDVTMNSYRDLEALSKSLRQDDIEIQLKNILKDEFQNPTVPFEVRYRCDH